MRQWDPSTTGRPASVITAREGGSIQVRLAGPVHAGTIGDFQKRLEGALPDGVSSVLLDLGAAEYLDSDGIRWIQRLQSDLSARHVELRLGVREGSRAERTLTLLRLEGAFIVERSPNT